MLIADQPPQGCPCPAPGLTTGVVVTAAPGRREALWTLISFGYVLCGAMCGRMWLLEHALQLRWGWFGKHMLELLRSCVHIHVLGLLAFQATVGV